MGICCLCGTPTNIIANKKIKNSYFGRFAKSDEMKDFLLEKCAKKRACFRCLNTLFVISAVMCPEIELTDNDKYIIASTKINEAIESKYPLWSEYTKHRDMDLYNYLMKWSDEFFLRRSPYYLLKQKKDLYATLEGTTKIITEIQDSINEQELKIAVKKGQDPLKRAAELKIPERS